MPSILSLSTKFEIFDSNWSFVGNADNLSSVIKSELFIISTTSVDVIWDTVSHIWATKEWRISIISSFCLLLFDNSIPDNCVSDVIVFERTWLNAKDIVFNDKDNDSNSDEVA